MRFLHIGKDGGPTSTVTGYWLLEIKRLFSAVFLKFENGSRDEYHSHAFGSFSWVLSGKLREQNLFSDEEKIYTPGLLPVVTRRLTFHRVVSDGTTWVFTLRGPWAEWWFEYSPTRREFSALQNGRAVFGTEKEEEDAPG